ncbi:MAG: inositol monophosphatase [Kiritimatiellae bacterium]|nr:inositol monophosphatase [Kiritimatiellia bacterium]
MKDPSLQELLDGAVSAARAAGDHALRHRDRRHEVAERTAHDVKLQLDRECQSVAEEVIHARFPSHAILGEEGTISKEPGAVCWIIDPIDGTVNFSHGLPQWCSAVAVRRGEEIVAGAVYVPAVGEMYTATIEEPARLNGEPIHPSTTPTLAEAMILTGLSKKMEENPLAFPQFEKLSRAVQKVRVMGAAALDICHVACGRADGYAESSIYLWDVAAAGLIARRAGARTEVLRQYSDVHMQFLCTNGRIHEQLKALVFGSRKE